MVQVYTLAIVSYSFTFLNNECLLDLTTLLSLERSPGWLNISQFLLLVV